MDGIRIGSNGTTALALLDSISDEFATHLKERLAEFCFGAALTAEDADYYSFEKTIHEFLRRYDSKPSATKIGMAGELIVHVLIPHTHSNLASSAVFFNKEERSIKKGFDLTFFQDGRQIVWYGEVKSGEVSATQSTDDKVKSLLTIAAADISNKLGDDAQRSRWDSALLDAALTLESDQARTAKSLLRSDASQLDDGNPIKKNVVLAAVAMHSIDHCEATQGHLVDLVVSLNSDDRFASMSVLTVQQHHCEAVIDHLRKAATDA